MIDKDLATAALAGEIGADLLVISTAVEKVCLNFGTPEQKTIDHMTTAQARAVTSQRATSNLAPCCQRSRLAFNYVESGGSEAIITCPEALSDTLAGRNGTHTHDEINIDRGLVVFNIDIWS